MYFGKVRLDEADIGLRLVEQDREEPLFPERLGAIRILGFIAAYARCSSSNFPWSRRNL